MSTTNAMIGYGTLLQRGDGATPENFTTVGEVLSITGPNLALNIVDATHMESPGATQEFIPGLIDPGTITMNLAFVPSNTTQSNLVTDLKNRTKRNFQIVFPDTGTTTWSFAGYVTGWAVTAPINDRLTADVTVKVTSVITES